MRRKASSPRFAASDDEQERLLAALEAQSRRAMGLDAAPPAKRRRIDPSDEESSAVSEDDEGEEWAGLGDDAEGEDELPVSRRALRCPADLAELAQRLSRRSTSPNPGLYHVPTRPSLQQISARSWRVDRGSRRS